MKPGEYRIWDAMQHVREHNNIIVLGPRSSRLLTKDSTVYLWQTAGTGLVARGTVSKESVPKAMPEWQHEFGQPGAGKRKVPRVEIHIDSVARTPVSWNEINQNLILRTQPFFRNHANRGPVFRFNVSSTVRAELDKMLDRYSKKSGTTSVGLWKRPEIFPIIARIIRDLDRKHPGFQQHTAIEAEMLRDAEASDILRAVRNKRVPKKTPEWEAMAMVAAFSQDYLRSTYADQFERKRGTRGYSYKPRNQRVEATYPDEVQMETGAKFPEGATQRVTINAYERSPEARELCLAKYGTNCSICGFSFGATYGEQFDGYIHVHHLRKLAEIGREYMIDPITDLRPVCPNCHAVLHFGNQTFTIEDVKKFLK